ncbi:MAG: hypothetical protein P1P74_01720 [Desulfuromonadales bacterium]|nr:hypothetical protein [Desulfuromonadales bacterium]MDT8422628.1 hypothetical protein [Desulfuromonadales bacterium]
MSELKKRTREEAQALLKKHGVPEDATLKSIYKEAHDTWMNLPWVIHRKTRLGNILEETAETYGFTHWMTLKTLMQVSDRVR